MVVYFMTYCHKRLITVARLCQVHVVDPVRISIMTVSVTFISLSKFVLLRRHRHLYLYHLYLDSNQHWFHLVVV